MDSCDYLIWTLSSGFALGLFKSNNHRILGVYLTHNFRQRKKRKFEENPDLTNKWFGNYFWSNSEAHLIREGCLEETQPLDRQNTRGLNPSISNGKDSKNPENYESRLWTFQNSLIRHLQMLGGWSYGAAHNPPCAECPTCPRELSTSLKVKTTFQFALFERMWTRFPPSKLIQKQRKNIWDFKSFLSVPWEDFLLILFSGFGDYLSACSLTGPWEMEEDMVRKVVGLGDRMCECEVGVAELSTSQSLHLFQTRSQTGENTVVEVQKSFSVSKLSVSVIINVPTRIQITGSHLNNFASLQVNANFPDGNSCYFGSRWDTMDKYYQFCLRNDQGVCAWIEPAN